MIELINPPEALRAARLFPAASLDATKPNLAGLRIEPITPNRLALAATDGFILAWTFLDREEPHGLAEALTVPASTFKALAKAAKGHAKPFLAFDPATGELRLGTPKDGIIISKPETGDYPQWRKVVPDPHADLHRLTGHTLPPGQAWQVAEVLADIGSRYSGPEAQHLTRLGARVGREDSSMILFHREGVWCLALEPRFSYSSPEVDLDALRVGLILASQAVPEGEVSHAL